MGSEEFFARHTRRQMFIAPLEDRAFRWTGVVIALDLDCVALKRAAERYEEAYGRTWLDEVRLLCEEKLPRASVVAPHRPTPVLVDAHTLSR